MNRNEIIKLEKALKKEVFGDNKNAFVVIDEVDYVYIDTIPLITLIGRYGFEKNGKCEKQDHFEIIYSMNESIDYIRGAFSQEVFRNENKKEESEYEKEI